MKAKNAVVGTRVVAKDLTIDEHSFFYLEGAKGQAGIIVGQGAFCADEEVVEVKFDNCFCPQYMWGTGKDCWNIPVEYLRLEK